jgi:hypothetical protein
MKQIAVTSKNINFTVPADYTDWKLGNGGRNDMAYKLNVIYDIVACKQLSIGQWVEPCAGYGFSSGLVHFLRPNVKLVLNDLDADRWLRLQRFKGIITNNDYMSKRYTNMLSLYNTEDAFIFFDAYSFTLNNREIVEYAKEYVCQFQNILISDVFCFSLKPFDPIKYKKYLRRLQDELCIGSLTAFVYPSKKCAIVTNVLRRKSIPIITESPSIFKTFKM